MGSFAIPSLPSLPNLKDLFNTSPPVVYPSARERRPRSRSNSIQNTPTKASRPVPSGSAQRNAGGQTKVFPASPADGRIGEQTPVQRRRSHSVITGGEYGFSMAHDPFGDRGRYPNNGRQPQLAHRRTQSVARLHTMGSPAPTNRLIEISKNASSSSSLSLPTLCEDGDQEFGDRLGGGLTISPIVRPLDRRPSRASTIALSPPSSPSPAVNVRQLVSDPASLPTGEPTGTDSSRHLRTFSSVPPPMAVPTHRSGLRRPPSCMSISEGLQPRHRGMLERKNSDLAPADLSDVSVMATWSYPSAPDPEARPLFPHPDTRSRSVDQPSEHLRERLRLLSSLDTTVQPAPSSTSASKADTPTPTMSPDPFNFTPRPLIRAKTTPVHNSHRHTLSSPQIALPLAPITLSGPYDTRPLTSTQPLKPLTRPLKRPTTSRLRQPNLLSMTSASSNGGSQQSSHSSAAPSIANTPELASSPGSMISDHLSTEGESAGIPSPSASFISLPALQHTRHVRGPPRSSSLHPNVKADVSTPLQGLGIGFNFGTESSTSRPNSRMTQSKRQEEVEVRSAGSYCSWRRYSVSSSVDDNLVESLAARLSRACFGSSDNGHGDDNDSMHGDDLSMADHGHGDDEDDELNERYLSLDDI